MKIVFFLHFYQPYNQQPDILDRIVNECYLPLTEGLKKIEKARVVVNINGVLSKMLNKLGYGRVLDNIMILYDEGKVEFTGSVLYHPFLPLLPENEIIRQISLNSKTNHRIFGKRYHPEGFFPPEMAVSPKVLEAVAKSGFKWIVAPQISHPLGAINYEKVYKTPDADLNVFFRNKAASSLMLSAVCRNAEDFVKETTYMHTQKGYWFCIMDAETFGHHRVGHEKFLFEVMQNGFFEPTLPKDILNSGFEIEEVTLRSSTWTNEEQDFWLDPKRTKPTEERSFILWKDPTNEIHKIQWRFAYYAISVLNRYGNKKAGQYKVARTFLDKALSSDQFWWASAKPWWSLEMVEQGAFSLLGVVKALYGVKSKEYRKALGYYRKILDIAFRWQRSGYIRKKHLEASATYKKTPFKDRTPEEWYNQVVLEFVAEMQKASSALDFEKAIKWRDALIKLSSGTDIYDIRHVVDELWSARTIPSEKPFLTYTWEEIPEVAKRYLRGVKTKEDFLRKVEEGRIHGGTRG